MIDRVYSDWYDDKPQSFGGIYRSYKKFKDLNKKEIEDSFKQNNIHS